MGYTEAPPLPSPPPPPAIIDVIPPTPTTEISEPPPLCVRCSCDIQKQDKQQQHEQNSKSLAETTSTSTNANPEIVTNPVSESLGNKVITTTLSDRLKALRSPTASINGNVEASEKNLPETLTKYSFAKSTPPASSVIPVKASVIASTSTTQLHRSQLCSTEVTSSSCSVINKQQGSSNSYNVVEQQDPIRANRPSTPHKPSNSKQSWKEQSSNRQVIQNKPSSFTPSSFSNQKQNKNNSTNLQKQQNVPLKPDGKTSALNAAIINKNVVKVPQETPLSTAQEKNSSPDESTKVISYPLKKHPLINIKTGNLLKLATSSIVSSKPQVLFI